MKEMFTWGVLVYNRNSVREKSMFRIQRSKNKIHQELIKRKLETIRSHYLRNQEGGQYKVWDVLTFAFLTGNSRYKMNYSPLHQRLI